MSDNEETKTVHIDLPVDHLTLRRYTLKVLKGPDAGMERSFDRRQVFVGTSAECQFSLNDPTVSRTHARIEFDSAGYMIRDEDSKNGVLVSGLRVKNAYLPPEADIVLGETTVRFRLGNETVDISISKENRFGKMIGRSVEMREIFAMLKRVAPTDATVLIEGESGTGKELVAEALHEYGLRRNKPFVIFDCSAVPHELMESELFGHVRGAFTGAVRDRAGVMEEANGGTLFLDEVGELPLDLQPKLLRALEKKEIKQVGGNRRVNFDVRILSATKRNLEEEVRAGNFREDLYYRLGVIRMELPPLRKRPDDIPPLADHFLGLLAGQSGGVVTRLSYDTMEKLKTYPWPGNVRELRNFLERSVILSGALQGGMLPLDLPGPTLKSSEAEVGSSEDTLPIAYDEPFKDAKERLVREFESRYFSRLLKLTDGNITKTARMAGIHRKSLEYLLKQSDLQRDLVD